MVGPGSYLNREHKFKNRKSSDIGAMTRRAGTLKERGLQQQIHADIITDNSVANDTPVSADGHVVGDSRFVVLGEVVGVAVLKTNHGQSSKGVRVSRITG